MQHLLSTGRTHVGHVTGPLRFAAARLRAQGAVETLASTGLTLAGGEPLYGEWTEEWGRQAADMLLRSAPELDAVFCGNDQIARGVADTLREAGRAMPDDIALVGFDNWEVIAAACRPPLTTVDMNLRELGRSAGERLLAAIDGRPGNGPGGTAMQPRDSRVQPAAQAGRRGGRGSRFRAQPRVLTAALSLAYVLCQGAAGEQRTSRRPCRSRSSCG